MALIYRVCLEGMTINEETFFSNRPDAEAAYAKKIEEKRNDEDTLDDETSEEQGEQEKNFSEALIHPPIKESNIKKLRGVYWSHGSMSGGDEPEFYSYTEEIVLEEITLES